MDKKCTIAICDDEANVLKVIANSVQAAFADKFNNLDVHSFTSTDKLKAFLEENAVDLIFLDIAMPGCDGIEFASRLRQRDSTIPIVFVTSAEDRVWDSFRVKPYGFVRKNRFLVDLLEIVDRFSLDAAKNQKRSSLCIIQKGKTYNFDAATIEYVESCQRNQKIFFSNGEKPVLISGYTLAHLAEELKPYGFYRVHKGYVINLSFVKLISAEGVYMESGSCIPINKRNISEFKTAFLEFSMENTVRLHV